MRGVILEAPAAPVAEPGPQAARDIAAAARAGLEKALNKNSVDSYAYARSSPGVPLVPEVAADPAEEAKELATAPPPCGCMVVVTVGAACPCEAQRQVTASTHTTPSWKRSCLFSPPVFPSPLAALLHKLNEAHPAVA